MKIVAPKVSTIIVIIITTSTPGSEVGGVSDVWLPYMMMYSTLIYVFKIMIYVALVLQTKECMCTEEVNKEVGKEVNCLSENYDSSQIITQSAY